MADFRIALGGTISAATTDEMHTALNGLKSDIIGANGKPKRIMRPLSAAATSATNTLPAAAGDTFQLSLGRPSAGRVWVVTRIVAISTDDHTTVANLQAALYIGDPLTFGLSQCVRSGQALPWTTTENEHAYVVHDREDLFVNYTATGAVTATQLVVNAMAWEYRDCDIDSQVI